MASIVVSSNLNVYNDPIEVQFYSTTGLFYDEILELRGITSYSLSDDNKTAIIYPSASEGTVVITGITKGIGRVPFTVYYGTKYEKETKNYSNNKNFYAVNQYYWQDTDDPKYIETQAVTDLFAAMAPDLTNPKQYIPILGYFNKTFPEYCANTSLGIIFSLAVQQYHYFKDKGIPQPYEYLNLYNITPADEPPYPLQSCIGKCIEPSLLKNGKYLEFKDFDDNEIYRARYGAVEYPHGTGDYQYCASRRAIRISAKYDGDPEFILQDWENTQGVPAAFEIVYRKTSMDFPDESGFSQIQFVIPSITRVPFSDYQPLAWITNIQKRIIAIACIYDGKDFRLRVNGEIGVFTWDVNTYGKLIDIGVWGA